MPRWIVIWFLISLPIVAWDVSFVLLRPLSMPGGSLDVLWIPYEKYLTVDLSYADLDSGFVRAQAIMSCLEVVMAVVALVLAHRRRLAPATLLVFCVSVLTCAKTLLIFLIELVTGFASVGHNAAGDLLLLYVLPNSVWIVMPLLVAWSTGRTLIARWSV
jgi:hypothetical protein